MGRSRTWDVGEAAAPRLPGWAVGPGPGVAAPVPGNHGAGRRGLWGETGVGDKLWAMACCARSRKPRRKPSPREALALERITMRLFERGGAKGAPWDALIRSTAIKACLQSIP